MRDTKKRSQNKSTESNELPFIKSVRFVFHNEILPLKWVYLFFALRVQIDTNDNIKLRSYVYSLV